MQIEERFRSSRVQNSLLFQSWGCKRDVSLLSFLQVTPFLAYLDSPCKSQQYPLGKRLCHLSRLWSSQDSPICRRSTIDDAHGRICRDRQMIQISNEFCSMDVAYFCKRLRLDSWGTIRIDLPYMRIPVTRRQ
ncbi:hypothetical protein MLD38_030172 [Melastoma candidum]|uniref:Uncharacterized protein n=1 Tax=Melastoma candidum TaxID=119954 RepID=A0ACB9MKV8_9MYRT|nr:hypothetical protein MLD38_030172 [Melastoma candidum]